MSAFSSSDYCLLKASTVSNKEQVDLQTQCWYHGLIKRVEVLCLLKDEGDFLVRDSISHPGDYVLTGFCNSKPVHFEINRNDEGLFHFEDEKFSCIIDLIEFYHAHKKEVTSVSGFVLGSPVLNSNNKASNWSNRDRLEDILEIEAAYAPYFGKAKAPLLQTLNRALGHRAVLNEAKKRWKEEFKTDQDIPHRLWAFSDDNTKENRVYEGTNIKEGSRTPSSSILKEEINDYCEIDYEAMDEEQQKEEALKAVDLKRRYSSSSHILLDASSCSQDLSSCAPFFSRLSSQSSNHLPLCCPPPIPSIGLIERARSCQSLISQTKNIYPILHNNNHCALVRFARTKIDPAPLLPARSNPNLVAESCRNSELQLSLLEENKQVDYDEISSCEYTRLPNLKKPPTPPKPTLAKLKALNQMSRELRLFVKTLCNTSSYRLGVLMSTEDCKVFGLVGETHLLDVFMDGESSEARQNISDRVYLCQTAVKISIQKTPNTSEVLEAWIRLAAFLLHDLGNAFSFGNIIASLLKNDLTSKLLKMNTCSAQLLQEQLLPVYKQMCQPSNCSTDYLLPFIQPYLLLFCDYIHPNLTKAIPCDQNFSERLALLCSFMKIARKMVCAKENYSNRASQLIDKGSTESDTNEKNMFGNDYLKVLVNE